MLGQHNFDTTPSLSPVHVLMYIAARLLTWKNIPLHFWRALPSTTIAKYTLLSPPPPSQKKEKKNVILGLPSPGPKLPTLCLFHGWWSHGFWPNPPLVWNPDCGLWIAAGQVLQELILISSLSRVKMGIVWYPSAEISCWSVTEHLVCST